jgi:hypothetical protein
MIPPSWEAFPKLNPRHGGTAEAGIALLTAISRKLARRLMGTRRGGAG